MGFSAFNRSLKSNITFPNGINGKLTRGLTVLAFIRIRDEGSILTFHIERNSKPKSCENMVRGWQLYSVLPDIYYKRTKNFNYIVQHVDVEAKCDVYYDYVLRCFQGVDAPFLQQWRYAGFSFISGDERKLTVWSEGIRRKEKSASHIQTIHELRQNFPMILGTRYFRNSTYSHYFDGDIACLQIYDSVLTEEQIEKAKTTCVDYQ